MDSQPEGQRGGGPLPVITEVKRTVAGVEKRFTCAVLAREGSHLIVLFVAPAAMHVHGVDLAAGTVTFGHFWVDRPYNVYHWLDPQTGATLGYYLNVSTDTRFTDDYLEWLDLIVDILVVPPAPALVLDQDEIPPEASPALRARIEQGTSATLADLPRLMADLERWRQTLWPRAQAQAFRRAL